MTPLPEDTAEDCLARADYAVHQAMKARTEEDRRRWLEIAQEWRTLAALRRVRGEAFDGP